MKKLNDLKQFYCDKCGCKISSIEEGVLEWVSNPFYLGGHNHEFKIIHKKKECQTHADTPDIHHEDLEIFVGEKGIINLISIFCIASKDAVIYNSWPETNDLRDFAEIIKRLFIPRYEECRKFYVRAIANNELDINTDISSIEESKYNALVNRYSLASE